MYVFIQQELPRASPLSSFGVLPKADPRRGAVNGRPAKRYATFERQATYLVVHGRMSDMRYATELIRDG
jgi:hypothetical protein